MTWNRPCWRPKQSSLGAGPCRSPCWPSWIATRYLPQMGAVPWSNGPQVVWMWRRRPHRHSYGPPVRSWTHPRWPKRSPQGKSPSTVPSSCADMPRPVSTTPSRPDGGSISAVCAVKSPEGIVSRVIGNTRVSVTGISPCNPTWTRPHGACGGSCPVSTARSSNKPSSDVPTRSLPCRMEQGRPWDSDRRTPSPRSPRIPSPQRPVKEPVPPLVTVFVDVGRATQTQSKTGIILDSGVRIGPDALDGLLCDSQIETILSRDGTRLAVGRHTRTINPALRRAILHGDAGVCTADACTSRHRLQARRITPYSRGGPTDPANLTTLCWYHHHVVIHGMGYQIDPDTPPQRRRFLKPSGNDPP